MISWEKFVQNIVRIVQYFREKVVIYVSSQLRWRAAVDFVQAEPDTCGLPLSRHLAIAPGLGKFLCHHVLLIADLVTQCENDFNIHR